MPDPFRYQQPAPERVVTGILEVMELGRVNMFRWREVADIAEELGYHETAVWVRGHPVKYRVGIVRGFTSEPEATLWPF